MIQPIMHDPLFLAQKSAPATPEDAPVARDLLDTLPAHAAGCVGMAASMIGVRKRLIAEEAEGGDLVLPVRSRRGLSFAGRCAENKSLAEHQGAVPDHGRQAAHQDLYRLDSADHPARDRPLRWDLDLNPIAHSPAWDDFECAPRSLCA